MSLLKVDPLPPVQHFAVVPSTSVEDALHLAGTITSSIAELLNMYMQSDGEHSNLAALEFSAGLAAELISASVSALEKSRHQGDEA
ncbi:hypothetical protein I5I61_31945 [Pseudomonas nitroreducens]|uniref:DUF3077 domain-containing protein n=1 Tax=Pseudomonas nitroreducens TaxID=46680 RepID=A0ABS0KVM9_PSENT|nr:hypothetical protein [Pseudomonas nitroreducens]MBG6292086.1 hypothetical protein [Pseudomonas nitroreducens]